MPRFDEDVARIALAAPARPGGMKGLGVDGARALMDAHTPPPGPEMAEVRDLTVPGPHGELGLRIYRPQDVPTPAPALVYCHGGGMILGSLDSFDAFARRMAEAAGVVVVSVGYRLAPEHTYPVANDEAYFAWEWVVGNNEQLKVDADRVGVAGDSAGGSLAASVALRARNAGRRGPALQLLLYPGIERASSGSPSLHEFADSPFLALEDIVWMKSLYLGENEATDTPDGVPSLAEHLAGLPPAIVVTGELDPLRDGAERFASRMRDASVPVVSLRVPGVGHGFMAQAEWIRRGAETFTWCGALVHAMLGTPMRGSIS